MTGATNRTVQTIDVANENKENKNKIYDFYTGQPIYNTDTKGNTDRSRTITTGKSKKGRVQPLKNKDDISRAKAYFKNEKEYRYNGINIRNYCLFVLGISIMRRISDILDFKVKDVMNVVTGQIVDSIYITENKTGKTAYLKFRKEVKEALSEYITYLRENDPSFSPENYLFKTRQSEKMTRNQGWKIMKQMGEELSLNTNVGTNTMRKTGAYQTFMLKKNDPYALAIVSDMLNHSSEKMTRHYIGLDEEEMGKIYDDMDW